MIRLSVPIPDSLWRRLRDLAEERRHESPTGRASVARLVRVVLEGHLGTP